METDVEFIKSFVSYDPETGILRWKVRMKPGVNAGDIAGSDNGDGYIRLTIKRKGYLGHRVAWALMTGKWPDDEIDHIDCCNSNNKWANLREAGRSGNNRNRRINKRHSTGFKGVDFRSGKFYSKIRIDKKLVYLGTFDTAEAAHQAYIDASIEHFGEFARAK